MINRLNQFIEYQGISVSRFEQQISASNGMIRKAITNNTDIQSKWLVKIIDNFPSLNIDWLLTGRGSMIKNNEIDEPNNTCDDKHQSKPDPKIEILEKMLSEKDEKIDRLNREVGRLLQMVEGFRDLQLKRCGKNTPASDVNAG